MREGWQEVKEVGLVEALEEVVQFTIHPLQQPGRMEIKQLGKPAGAVL